MRLEGQGGDAGAARSPGRPPGRRRRRTSPTAASLAARDTRRTGRGPFHRARPRVTKRSSGVVLSVVIQHPVLPLIAPPAPPRPASPRTYGPVTRRSAGGGVHHHQVRPARPPGDGLPDPAPAAQDHVAAHGPDPPFHPAPPEGAVQVPLDQGVNAHAEGIGGRGDPDEDQHDREHFLAGAERPGLAETNRAHRDDRLKHSIEQAQAEADITDRPGHQDREAVRSAR